MTGRTTARWSFVLILFALAAAPVAAQPAADVYAGTFRDASLTVVLRASGAGYTGTIQMAGATYPLSARAAADGGIAGRFTSAGGQFDFTATVAGDTLTFATGRTKYELARVATARPPRGGGVNPLGGATAAEQAEAAITRAKEHVYSLLNTHGNWEKVQAREAVRPGGGGASVFDVNAGQ